MKSLHLTRGCLAYLQLVRLPNVFTAAADVAAGYAIVSAGAWSSAIFGALTASSCLLYAAGMVLNDVFDLDVDAKERPQRPLPSGRISVSTARLIGVVLLGFGVAAGWLAAWLANSWTPGAIATLLAGTVFAYDGLLKRTPLGPVAMGACRGLNLLLGMSVATVWGPPHVLAALGLFAYIAGLTWYARTEARTSTRLQLAGATIVLIVGISLVASFAILLHDVESVPPAYDAASPTRAFLLIAVLGAVVVRRCLRGVARPYPGEVQSAVKLGILSLILFDATMCFAVRGPVPAIAIAALLAPAMFLGRWIYST